MQELVQSFIVLYFHVRNAWSSDHSSMDFRNVGGAQGEGCHREVYDGSLARPRSQMNPFAPRGAYAHVAEFAQGLVPYFASFQNMCANLCNDS